MAEEGSYIESKNEDKSATKDMNIGKFFVNILIGIALVIVYFYFASVNILLSYKHSSSPLAGQNLLLVPYTPFNKMSEYVMYSAKNSFGGFKRHGGFKMPSLNDLFPMDAWSFPYKNKFTEKQYERTNSENTEDIIFQIVSWFTDSTAASFSTGRSILQMYFTSTNSVIKTLDEDTKTENKIGELVVMLLGTPLLLFSILVLTPLFSVASTVAYSLFNIGKVLPPFLGFNVLTWLYIICILPVFFNFIFIMGGISLNSSINSFILPIIFLFFVLQPLFNKEMRVKIGNMMFTKKRLASFFIMLTVIISATNNLGSEVGLYISIAGAILILLMFFNLM